MSRKLSLLGVLVWLGGCAVSQDGGDNGPHTFEIGGVHDPVVQRAMALGTQPDHRFEITITNDTTHDFAEGMLTRERPFTPDTYDSSVDLSFVYHLIYNWYYARNGGVSPYDVSWLADEKGWVVDTDVFAVPEIPVGDSVTMTVDVPLGTQLYYTASALDQDFQNSYAFVHLGPFSNEGDDGAPLSGSLIPDHYTAYDATTGTYMFRWGSFDTAPDVSGIAVVDQNDCPTGALSANSQLHFDGFSDGANDSAWPATQDYDGDFNGDWWTDGNTARPTNPNWPGTDPSAPNPAITGFVKFIDVCPQSGAVVTVESDVTTDFTSNESDTTLVVYSFDQAGSLLDVTANLPLGGQLTTTIGAYDVAVPGATRRLAVVPMAYLSASEEGTVYYDSLDVDYRAVQSQTITSLVADSLDALETNVFGNNQPVGWAEYGGDWYGYAANGESWVTLWNPVWGGDQSNPLPIEAGMIRDVPLSTTTGALDYQAFVAVTFTDAASFARLRLVFDTGDEVESGRVSGTNYADLALRDIAIPAAATSVSIAVDAYLGPDETSSLYVDDIRLSHIE